MIFNIQRYSTHDGEGIRTVIFYKGCPLRCRWCSNPESQSFLPEILFNERLCKKIGDCYRTNPDFVNELNGSLIINRSVIPSENLRKVCPARAITIAGEHKTTTELIHEIEKDLSFYKQSNGGVTISGGEPLAQDQEIIIFLRQLKKKNIHVAAETSLHVEWKKIVCFLGLVDTFLVDIKHMDPIKFRQYTGGNLSLVMRNLKKLVQSGEHIIPRIPVIPHFNHPGAEIREIIDFILSLKAVDEIHFIPYHILGTDKYGMLGREYPFNKIKPLDHTEIKDYESYAVSKGLKTKIGG